MAIQFTNPVEIIVQKEEKKTISSLTVISVIDQPINKKVIASTREAGTITLWEGAAYDAIGQWTDTDVENALKAIYE